jgi:hypothetical protein
MKILSFEISTEIIFVRYVIRYSSYAAAKVRNVNVAPYLIYGKCLDTYLALKDSASKPCLDLLT